MSDLSKFVPTHQPLAASALGKFVVEMETRHGRITAPRLDIYVTPSLVHYGEYSEAEIEVLRWLIPADATVIEGGANFGAISLGLLSLLTQPTARLYAIEPQPDIYAMLAENLNRATYPIKVTALPLALWHESANLYVPTSDLTQPGNYGGVRMLESKEAEADTPVPAITLDQLTRQLRRVDLVKLDIEGAEVRALMGAQALIETHRPIFYVENDRPKLSQLLLATLLQNGYRCWWHIVPLFNPRNWLGNPKDIFPPRLCSFNVLALPDDRASPIPDDPWRITDSGSTSTTLPPWSYT